MLSFSICMFLGCASAVLGAYVFVVAVLFPSEKVVRGSINNYHGSLSRNCKGTSAIEYYPETDIYFCTHNGRYLKSQNGTGIVSYTSFDYADRFKTEDGAMRLLNLYHEQQFKENIVRKVVDVVLH